MKHKWTIEQSSAGARLDVFLCSQIEGKTRSSIAKLLKNGAGIVNGKTASVHRFLKIGDNVTFDDSDVMAHGVRPVRKGEPTKKVSEHIPKIKILEETPDWMVINKPAGLLVHPDASNPTGTLVDFLIKHDPAIAKIGEDSMRPGIMHRLDKDVSGLMVIAKTQDAFDNLKSQFAEHSVDKTYLALVHGDVLQDEGDIKFRIARSKNKPRMAARPVHETAGRAAWTHYKVIKRFRGAALLELNIFSGRTHQIRAHLFALQHPVIGDGLYSLKQPDRKVQSPRLLLQAIRLSFSDPKTGERMTFSLPPDLAFAATEKSLV
jgi:23S rRNA pseudouridine1911/1915/1917 synthase